MQVFMNFMSSLYSNSNSRIGFVANFQLALEHVLMRLADETVHQAAVYVSWCFSGSLLLENNFLWPQYSPEKKKKQQQRKIKENVEAAYEMDATMIHYLQFVKVPCCLWKL